MFNNSVLAFEKKTHIGYSAFRFGCAGCKLQRARFKKRNITMIDIPLSMFINLVVTDAVNYQKYEKGFFPLLKKSGGEFGTYEDQPLHLEEISLRPGRMIPFRFPSEQGGRDWCANVDCQVLSEFRRA